MAILTPDIGAQGTFKVAQPYDALLIDGLAYTCKAVRAMADITASGQDPYTVYYLPYNIDQSKYAADLAAGANIISLFSSSGSMVYIPDSYILSFPATGGVPYSVVSLAATLSALPDSVDLTAIKNQIIGVIKNTLGIDATVFEVQLSPTQLISAAQHATYEAARQAAIQNKTTKSSQLIACQAQLADAQTQIGLLQAYIKDHIAPPAGS